MSIDFKNKPIESTSDNQVSELLREFNQVGGSWKLLAQHYANDGHVDVDVLRVILMNMEIQSRSEPTLFYSFAKNSIDVILACVLIVLLSPIFIVVGFLVKWSSPGPVLYRQTRTGLYFKPFHIYKFRTMHEGSRRKFSFLNEESLGPLSRSTKDPRVTRIGKFLRLWCLDELPQLFNVVLGNMSLVGPRPLSPDDSATTPKKYCLRYAAKPGMTGLWQVEVRSTNDGLLKIRLDCEYVKNRTIMYDLKLLVQTIGVVLKAGLHLDTNFLKREQSIRLELDQKEKMKSFKSRLESHVDDDVKKVS